MANLLKHWSNVNIFPVTDVALDREVEGDLLVGDMGQGMPFRPGTFDGCIRWRTKHAYVKNQGFILNNFWLFFMYLPFVLPPVSISALQWLCNADKRTHSPPKRLYAFFSTLYSSLVRFYHSSWLSTTKNQASWRHILQWRTLLTSPCSLSFSQEAHVQFFSFIQRTQNRWNNNMGSGYKIWSFLHITLLTFSLLPSLKLELITTQAMRAGFGGGMVVDYPNSSKAKKSVPIRSVFSCSLLQLIPS